MLLALYIFVFKTKENIGDKDKKQDKKTNKQKKLTDYNTKQIQKNKESV